MAQKLKFFIITLGLLALIPIAASGSHVQAAYCTNTATDKACNQCSSQACDNGRPTKKAADCPSGKIDPTDNSKCLALGNGCDQTTGICSNNPIVKDLNDVVNVLSGLVGVAVVGAIILGGIQYAMAGDKAEAVSAAKKRIINGVIALVAFLFIFAFLQWLIPGGIFK